MSQRGKQFVIKTRHRNEILKRRICLVSTGARWKFGHELSLWFRKCLLVNQSSQFSSFSADVTTGKSLCHSQIKSDENSEKRIVSYLYWSTLEIVARFQSLAREKVTCSSNTHSESWSPIAIWYPCIVQLVNATVSLHFSTFCVFFCGGFDA